MKFKNIVQILSGGGITLVIQRKDCNVLDGVELTVFLILVRVHLDITENFVFQEHITTQTTLLYRLLFLFHMRMHVLK